MWKHVKSICYIRCKLGHLRHETFGTQLVATHRLRAVIRGIWTLPWRRCRQGRTWRWQISGHFLTSQHCPQEVSGFCQLTLVFNGFQLPTIMRKGAKRIRIDKVTVKAFSKSLSHDSSAHCWAYAWPMLYLSDTYPESEWQSFQPPSPLAPGRSAEQASCLSLTAQLASEIFNSLKKFSLGVYSSYLKPSQPSRPCFHSQSQAKVSASQGYDKI